MKLTREISIYQCPVSTKYCLMPLNMLEPNTVDVD